MEDSEPEPSNSSIKSISYPKINSTLFSIILILFIHNSLNAQRYIDSTKARIFYQKVVRTVDCGGSGEGMSQQAFFLLLMEYSKPEKDQDDDDGLRSRNYYHHSHSHSDSETYSKKNDSSTRIIYIHDTVVLKEPSDTVFMMADAPTADDISMTQKVMKKILRDEGFKEIIRETISEMSADELNDFKKDMNKEFRQMKNEMAVEQARRKVAELEAKKEERLEQKKERKEKRIERKEKWKALSKEERKELIKAKAALMAHETAMGVGATAAAAGAAVVGTGAILGAGILAIGKGIVKAPLGVWNWLDKRFYVNIDLSCSEQARLRAYRKVHNYSPPKVRKYSGHCPGW